MRRISLRKKQVKILPAREIQQKDHLYMIHDIVRWIKIIHSSKSHSEFFVEYPAQQWLCGHLFVEYPAQQWLCGRLFVEYPAQQWLCGR